MLLLLRKSKAVIFLAFLLLIAVDFFAQQDKALSVVEDKKSLAALRKNAINTLVKKKEPKLIPILINIVKDTKEDESLRKRAILAFKELKAVEGIDPLGAVLADTEDTYMIKPDIIQALSDIGGEEAKKVLADAFLGNVGNPIIADETLAALGKMKGKIPVEYMGPALMSGSDEVVKNILKLIKTTKDASAVPVMLPLLNKKSLEIKKEVLTITAGLGVDVVPMLILRLDDKDPAFRTFLAEMLNKAKANPMKPFYYKEFDRFIEAEEDTKIKAALVKARKKIKA